VSPAKIHSKGPVARDLFVPAVGLDRASTIPLCEQLRTQLAVALRRDGRAGARLPSTRMLARMLGVSRNTILTAYEELAAEGLIEGRPGSGMIIAAKPAGAMSLFDPARALSEAQYPSRTIAFEDPDGSPLYLRY
jgi:GntR family transcriptional regulator/MocR family aminotransferase